jgi:branched-chain amino acid transport system permease protein
MDLAATCVINGILVGGVYALLGMGIVLIYKATSVYNFAMGQMAVFGAFIAYSCMKIMELPIIVCVVVGVLAGGLMGLVVERFALRKLIGQPLIAALIATLAVSVLLKGVVVAIWSSSVIPFPREIFPKSELVIGGVQISGNLFGSFLIALLGFVIFTIYFRKSSTGLAMRAVAEEHQIAQSLGVRVTSVFATTWFIGGLVCAIGGICLADKVALGVNEIPAMTFMAFPAVLIGGLESVAGVAIGGLIIGLAENFCNAYVSQSFGEIAPWLIVILILIIRPEGLWGLKRIERI